MKPREVTRDPAEAPAAPFTSRTLILHGKPNWSAVLFFACLCVLHLYIARRAGASSRGEALVGGLFGGGFLVASIVCSFIHTDVTIAARQRLILIRSGVGRFCIRRRIPFTAVHAVRVTLPKATARPVSRIEILCDDGNIQCPPTSIPRQEALYLALVMGVRLIKVHPADSPSTVDKAPRF